MLIDWFTVGAQVLNFVILVALLKRFLYRPVLDAIDAREALIARQLADADAARTAARQEREDFERRNKELEARREALLKKATDDADAERKRLMDAAREAADAAIARRQDADSRDSDRRRRDLADRTRIEVLAIARRVVGDLADATLDERIAAVFRHRLATLGDAELVSLASGLQAANGRAIVRTAGELAGPEREALRTAVTAALRRGQANGPATPIDVAFESAPELTGGIELVVGGRKTGWNVSQYLDSLEKAIRIPMPTAASAAVETTA